MEYIYGKFQNVSNYFFLAKTDTCSDPKEITRFEYYLERAYTILSWKEPSSTWIVFLMLNFTFWLIVQLQLRIFGILFVTVLLAFISDFLFEKTHLTPLHSENSDSIRNLCTECVNVITAFKAWRQHSPASFCIGMCIMFLGMSFTAGNLSGYILFYLGFLGLFFLPLFVTKIPPQHLSTVKGVFYSLISQEGASLAEDELIPFISGKDFNTRDPELESLLTDKTADSVTNSLISGISTMPSYLDADEPNEIGEEDLLPAKSGVSYTPGDISSDSDSEIHFDPTHFDGNTSSEDEKFFGKGLKFKEVDATDGISKAAIDAPSDAPQAGQPEVSVLNRIVSTLMQTRDLVKLPRKDSSSDSEFEIIESNELN